MDNSINNNQTGYIRGTFIGNNFRLILDILEYFENNNKNDILLSLIFKKPPIQFMQNETWNKTSCPVSALLFLFLMETLNLKSNNCRDIKEFKINSLEKEIKCLPHEDDCTFPLEDQLSLENALNLF